MTTTAKLNLPYIAPSQAQKHVTHNEALKIIDTLIQLSVRTKSLKSPPSSPQEGDRYIVAGQATGQWRKKDNQIAQWLDANWLFYRPVDGWRCFVIDDNVLYGFIKGQWHPLTTTETTSFLSLSDTPNSYRQHGQDILQITPDGAGLQFSNLAQALEDTNGSLTKLGINTNADDNNRLAIKTNALLASHDEGKTGTGSVQFKLNKAKPANTASFLFQTGYSGRCEFGLIGSDGFSIKTSTDGVTWQTVLRAKNGDLLTPNGIAQQCDGRNKTAIANLDGASATQLLDAIAPKVFRWNKHSAEDDHANDATPSTQHPSPKYAGFIAQEVKAALDASASDLALWCLSDSNDKDSRQWLRTMQFIPILWAALRQTRREIDTLRGASTKRYLSRLYRWLKQLWSGHRQIKARHLKTLKPSGVHCEDQTDTPG